MTVTVKLFATFRNGRFKVEEKDYPPGTRIGDVVKALGIEEQALGMVMLNSRHTPLDQELSDGDALSLFPLVGGG